jgi:hypothetical protein
MSKAGWYSHFPEPILTPKGDLRVTLREGAYITRLSKTQYDRPAWQNAMHVLIQAAERGDPVESARRDMMQALYPKDESVHRARNADPHWGRRKLARGR